LGEAEAESVSTNVKIILLQAKSDYFRLSGFLEEWAIPPKAIPQTLENVNTLCL